MSASIETPGFGEEFTAEGHLLERIRNRLSSSLVLAFPYQIGRVGAENVPALETMPVKLKTLLLGENLIDGEVLCRIREELLVGAPG
jgi:hypothetical protein